MEELLKDFGKAVVRTPLYSWEVLFNEAGETKNLEDLVWLFLDDPVFMEGLYWGSPQLYNQVLKLKEGNIKETKKNNLLYTLKKYLVRASTRPTPYGIFAGSGIKDFDEAEPGLEPQLERKVRIDMALMQSIKLQLESDPSICLHLLYTVNNSLYRIPGQYRFTETVIENGKWNYQLSSVDHTPLLEKVQMLVSDDKLSCKKIYELSKIEAPFEVFYIFLKELIQSQFLVSELRLGPTVEDELVRYIGVLQRLKSDGIKEAQKYLTLLLSMENIANRFTKLPVGNLPLDEIEDLKRQLEDCKIVAHQGHLFHADLKKASGNFVFSTEKVNEIKRGIAILGKLSGSNDPHEDQMKCFIQLFQEKYGTREVPLSVALDPEYGIGFPPQEKLGDTVFNSMIEKIKLTGRKAENDESLLQEKARALYGPPNVEEIRFEEEDLPDLENNLSKLPGAFSVMGSLLPSGKILIEGVGKAHANSLLGRFACLDERIHDLCKGLAETERESNKEVLFAEIVFQPGGRIGNVARRPSFFEYEIPLLASPGVQEDRCVPVQDLMVSIYRDEIILRSRKLNKRIIPRLSNAHNYARSTLPVYKFLSVIQYSNRSGFNIDWSNFAGSRRFLPRVTCQNLILHRACWFLSGKDIATIRDAVNPVEHLRSFLLKWNIPKLISLAEGDNELFIDTANPDYLELLAREIQYHPMVKLVEWPFGVPSRVAGRDGQTVQQFIMPLSQKKASLVEPLTWMANAHQVKDKFIPGSDWVYFKIYCGANFSDQILMSVVKPAIDTLLKEGVIRKAFFIRYTDPHYHIRFRLHLDDDTDKKHLARVLEFVYNRIRTLSDDEAVWNVQLDTYRRETERYGEDRIDISEEVFFYDSLLYLNCLKHEVFTGNDETRFLAATKNMDRWLSLFGMGLKKKADYCLEMCERFSNEFSAEVKFQVDLKYRELGDMMFTFLDSLTFDHEFRARDDKLRKLELSKKNLESYIHMSMNRWFLADQRLMEYMCYLFCNKYYIQLLHHNRG